MWSRKPIPVATFASGDANRDTHMLEAMEAGSFPFATVKLALRLPPGRELPDGPVPADAEVDLHGVKRRATVPVSVARQPDGTLRARCALRPDRRTLSALRTGRAAHALGQLQPGAAVGLDSGTQEAHWTLARSINPGVPVFSSETYPGWLTHWNLFFV